MTPEKEKALKDEAESKYPFNLEIFSRAVSDAIRKAYIAGATSEAEKSNWISVEDDLPEYEQVVDTWDGKANNRCVFKEYGKRFVRHVEAIEGERIYVVYYEGITHWQPLAPAKK